MFVLLQSSLTVRVLLEDVNEHTPKFPKNHYIINLPEVRQLTSHIQIQFGKKNQTHKLQLVCVFNWLIKKDSYTLLFLP